MAIMSLAYVGLGVTDVLAWVGFAGEILGMQEGPSDGEGTRTLRMDDKALRIALEPNGANDILFAGFDVGDEAGLIQLDRELTKSGIATRPLTSVEIGRRTARAGIRFSDPDGLALEAVYGLRSGPPFEPRRELEFVTGDMGLGHIVLNTTDLDRSLAFYERIGFAISDFIQTDLGPVKDVRIAFLRCNARHHTLAIAPLPSPRRLDHLMVEVASVDSVIEAYYRSQKKKFAIKRHLGRHTNDRMLSFYVRTPAGFDVELGCGGVRVEEAWPVKTWDAISVWGHEP